MHYDENEPRHPDYRRMHRHEERRMRHPDQEQHFNDSRSRWQEPRPFVHPHHQENNWHEQDMGHQEGQHRSHPHREDWHDQHQDYHSGEHYQEPAWRRRDEHFDRSNQRVEDRWHENDSPMMPNPQHHNRHRRPHPRDRYWE